MPRAGKRWLTAPRPHVDRCATAWLVKRFVDPKARFGFLAPGAAPPRGAITYDLPHATYTHQGPRCTFEVVAREHGLDEDPAVRALGRIVRDIDLHRLALPESVGVDAVLRGMALAQPDDRKLLAQGAQLFEGLYARERARSRRR